MDRNIKKEKRKRKNVILSDSVTGLLKSMLTLHHKPHKRNIGTKNTHQISVWTCGLLFSSVLDNDSGFTTVYRNPLEGKIGVSSVWGFLNKPYPEWTWKPNRNCKFVVSDVGSKPNRNINSLYERGGGGSLKNGLERK